MATHAEKLGGYNKNIFCDLNQLFFSTPRDTSQTQETKKMRNEVDKKIDKK
jgi:hypothetical protein